MNIQQRLTQLERVKSTASQLPAFVYYSNFTSEHTPDRAEAFIKYKEQWRDDGRYGHIINHFKTVDDLEAYIEANNLPASTIINITFIGTDIEATV